MDHPRIDDEKVVDRYLAGRLSAEDEARFEEHLFACSACLEQVRWGEELRRGLQSVAAREGAARAAVTLGLLAWLRGRRPAQRAGLAALGLIVALLPAALLWQQVELDRARAAAAGVAGLAEPTGALRVVSLGAVRDGSADLAEIRADAGDAAMLFSLELPAPDAVAARYRVTLRDAAGTRLWRGDDLEPTLYDTLLVAVPATYLAAGRYRFVVESLGSAGAEPAGEMAFRIVTDR